MGTDPITPGQAVYPYRTVFLSDIHLGSRGCRADLLLRFLQVTRAQTLFLVGDIIDVESLQEEFYWPRLHNDVLRALFAAAHRGTRVVYIPGNHDRLFRRYCGMRIGNIEVRRAMVFTGTTGMKHLVIHGDEFDGIIACSAWLDWLGRAAYRGVLRLNGVINRVRMRLGYGYWPLAPMLKHRSRIARQYIGRFRDAALQTAHGCGLQGVICGHIHRPEISVADGVSYHNIGDWVEHCSALVERPDGQLELLDWPAILREIQGGWRGAVIPRAA